MNKSPTVPNTTEPGEAAATVSNAVVTGMPTRMPHATPGSCQVGSTASVIQPDVPEPTELERRGGFSGVETRYGGESGDAALPADSAGSTDTAPHDTGLFSREQRSALASQATSLDPGTGSAAGDQSVRTLPTQVSSGAPLPAAISGAQTVFRDTGSDAPTVLTPSRQPERPAPPLFAGRYELLQELGRGGMGAVHLARDCLLNIQVAIKTLLPGRDAARAAEQMRTEASLAIRLTHPNVMRIYDVHFVGEQQFIVMEYIAGRPLDALLRERRVLAPALAMDIVRQVADGLNHAHEAGIIHRDIKPGNILLVRREVLSERPEATDEQYAAKILDFGIARAQADVRTGGTRAGTFGYMPPEQFLGRRYDRRVDVFALGVMAFELLTGRLPFEGNGAFSPQVRPARADQFSSEVNLILHKALKFNPADRWATSLAFADALDRALRKGTAELAEPTELGGGGGLTTAATMPLDTSATAQRGSLSAAATEPVTVAQAIVHPADGAPMVLVPPSSFRMGTAHGEPDEGPEHEVGLSGYYVDVYPVTNARYATFLNEVRSHQDDAGHVFVELGTDTPIRMVGGRYVVREAMEDHPVSHVSWFGAEAYCNWAGKRLLTEAEWERAARGTDRRPYPWGSTEPNESNRLANCGGASHGTTPVGNFEDASPVGCHDMAGNVLEWCADWFSPHYYRQSPKKDPQGPPQGTDRVCRGGCYHFDAYSVRTTYRVNMDPAHLFEPTGFRCAMSV
jgi:serine/threonine-protein kinase